MTPASDKSRSDELMPCPFCGGPGKLWIRRVAEDAMMAVVECEQCGASREPLEDAYAPTADAIEAWNFRTPSPSTAALVEALEPFSKEARHWCHTLPDDEPIFIGNETEALGRAEFTVGDLRRATLAAHREARS